MKTATQFKNTETMGSSQHTNRPQPSVAGHHAWPAQESGKFDDEAEIKDGGRSSSTVAGAIALCGSTASAQREAHDMMSKCKALFELG